MRVQGIESAITSSISLLIYQWIGVNTEYLTDVAYTTTVDNQPTVTTIPAAIVATTATATGDGLIPGDVSVAFSPKLVDTLKSLAAEAESACSIRRRRTTCNVNERFAQRVFEELSPGGRLGFIDTGILATIPTVNGPQIASILRNAEVLPTAGIGIFLLWQIKGQLSAWTMAPGSDSTVGGDDDDDDDDGCPEDAPKGVDAVSACQINRSQNSCTTDEIIAILYRCRLQRR